MVIATIETAAIRRMVIEWQFLAIQTAAFFKRMIGEESIQTTEGLDLDKSSMVQYECYLCYRCCN
jgi:hypothetical protein